MIRLNLDTFMMRPLIQTWPLTSARRAVPISTASSVDFPDPDGPITADTCTNESCF